MPGCAGCQLFAFEQDDVFPALAGQMICDRAAMNAAADYDNLRVFRQLLLHEVSLFLLRLGRG